MHDSQFTSQRPLAAFGIGLSLTIFSLTAQSQTENQLSITSTRPMEAVSTDLTVVQLDSIIGTDQKYEYAYDALGRLTQSITAVRDVQGWSERYMETFAYDEAGNAVLDDQYYKYDDIWYGDFRYEYAYDAQRRQMLAILYLWNDDAWLQSQKAEFTYDDEGRTATIVNSLWDNGVWSELLKVEYAYDEWGYQTHVTNYTRSSGDWSLQSGEITEYDQYDNERYHARCHWSDGVWTEFPLTKRDYEYDEQGRVLQSVYYNRTHDAWVGTHQYVYAYDDLSLTTTILHSVFRSDTWQESGKQEITYDPLGNVTMQTDYRYDCYDDDWEGDTRQEYAYDEQGHRTLSVEYYWGNGSWIESLRHQTLYDLSTTVLYWGDNKIVSDVETHSGEVEETRYCYSTWQEMGILRPSIDAPASSPSTYMDLTGRVLTAPIPGHILLQRQADGKVRKVTLR